jgi:uncharacterized protein YceK
LFGSYSVVVQLLFNGCSVIVQLLRAQHEYRLSLTTRVQRANNMSEANESREANNGATE